MKFNNLVTCFLPRFAYIKLFAESEALVQQDFHVDLISLLMQAWFLSDQRMTRSRSSELRYIPIHYTVNQSQLLDHLKHLISIIYALKGI